MTTLNLALTEEWTEVGSALMLADGTEYNAVAVDGPVEVVRTASAAAPGAAVRGRPLWPGSAIRPADPIDYTPEAGVFLHARAHRGRAVLVVDDSP